jgi:ABC-type branched-subunit amino acid transport system ATPase component/branched-subunit amino acid ABC-type transport system permease component
LHVLPIIVIGLASGGLYALSAIGLVCIYRGSRVLNLALGGVAAWGGYLFVSLRDAHGIPALLAGAIVLAAAAAFGIAVYFLLIRPIRGNTELLKIVMTLGLLSVLTGTIVIVFGTQPQFVSSSLPKASVHVFGTDIGEDRLLIILIAAVLSGAFGLWSAYGKRAIATRAMADNEAGVTALGYSPNALGALNWALGSMLAALAGMLLAPIVGLSPGSIPVIVVPALSAALLGRFVSYGWAFGGGLVLGVLEALATRYISMAGWGFAVPFIVVVAVLIGRRDLGANRSRIERAMPIARELGWGNACLLAALAAVVALGSEQWTSAVTLTMCFAILTLSLVVVVGYVNQISLAQLAIAGIAAILSIQLMSAGLPFVFVPIVAAIIGAAVGLVIAVPALRLSGVNLAVVTIGASVALSNLVFDQAGGVNGFTIKPPTLFGANLLSILYPRSYGFFVLFWLAVAVLAVMALRRSGLGRQLLALRTNERAATALGVNVARAKILAFCLASALAGLGGILLVTRLTNASFGMGWDYTDSVNLVVTVILAGVTSARGGILAGALVSGGLAFTALTQVSWISNNYALVSGALLILTVLINPRGATFIPERPGRQRDAIASLPVASQQPARPLKISGVSVAFGGVQAVSDVSVEINSGTVVGIIGPNGAGKTTLLDAICGFTPMSGSVRLGDTELTGLAAHRRVRQGLARVFQGTELFDDLTIAQNLSVGREASGQKGISQAARDWIEMAGIGADMDKLPASLSLGQRKLVGVARALVAGPSILLLDEPGAGLGHRERQLLSAAVRMLAERYDMGIAVIDHDMPLILATCGTTYVLVNGRLLAQGTPDAVLSDEAVRHAYLGSVSEAAYEALSARTAASQEVPPGPAGSGTNQAKE